MKLSKAGGRPIAFMLLLAATLHSIAAQAYDGRSPFGIYGRNDWHSPDRNWDGSPITPDVTSPPPATQIATVPNNRLRCCQAPTFTTVILPVGDEILAQNLTTSLGKPGTTASLFSNPATSDPGNGTALINSLLDITNQTLNLTLSKVLTSR
ncbi:hypothetical protein QU481_04160 [Crenobacter sp. SG2303]|uniref:Uncharacterized protein n=1 Tax=Crenobacter oryzisoli TaxID=3056844 RepID=A0ABT7XJX1_9NEIS|nr:MULTISPECIES: hypothetical protein [unclassified Crenobacter]MDN0074082.1 hypothetical protein [Crenobacter sp. SG2303]MDN0084010.1 hypothetical protein [Crenobacter sp. SG2305]